MAQSACPGPATRLVALLLLGLIRVYRHWISPLLGPRCHPSSLTVVDVDDDPALQARFGLEVPVLLMPAEGAPPRPLPRVPPPAAGSAAAALADAPSAPASARLERPIAIRSVMTCPLHSLLHQVGLEAPASRRRCSARW